MDLHRNAQLPLQSLAPEMKQSTGMLLELGNLGAPAIRINFKAFFLKIDFTQHNGPCTGLLGKVNRCKHWGAPLVVPIAACPF
jgi:hypothetical protein